MKYCYNKDKLPMKQQQTESLKIKQTENQPNRNTKETKRLTDEWTDGWTDRWTDGRTDGQKQLQVDERTQ